MMGAAWVPKAVLTPLEAEKLGFSKWTEEKIDEMQRYRRQAQYKQAAMDERRKRGEDEAAIAREEAEREAAKRAEALRLQAEEAKRNRVRRRRPSKPKFSIDLWQARKQCPEMREAQRHAHRAEAEAEARLQTVREDVRSANQRIMQLEEAAAVLEQQQKEMLDLAASYRANVDSDEAALRVQTDWLEWAPGHIEMLLEQAQSAAKEQQRLEEAKLPLLVEIQAIPIRSNDAGKKMVCKTLF
eukprot:SAG31_NODE_7187_length_1762_cov_1.438966_3_plen_242_part_00